MATFYGIGTGPGDPELLTLKAVKCLGRLDVLYTPQGKKDGDSIARKIVAAYLKPEVEVRSRYFPMSLKGEDKVYIWDEIAKEIIETVQEGKEVGFVTLGDPMIYSTYAYILERVKSFIPVETLSGISSFSQIAASQNFPLVMEEETLVVLPCTTSDKELDYALSHYRCIVLMKVYRHFEKIFEKIKAYNLLEYAVLVSDTSKANEVVYKDLENPQIAEKIGYFSTILIHKK